MFSRLMLLNGSSNRLNGIFRLNFCTAAEFSFCFTTRFFCWIAENSRQRLRYFLPYLMFNLPVGKYPSCCIPSRMFSTPCCCFYEILHISFFYLENPSEILINVISTTSLMWNWASFNKRNTREGYHFLMFGNLNVEEISFSCFSLSLLLQSIKGKKKPKRIAKKIDRWAFPIFYSRQLRF